MNLRSVISDRVGRCPMCDSPWGVRGEIWTGEGLTGWYCSPSCVGTAVERATSPNRAQNVVQRYAEPSKPVFAPNARETAIARAHEENIAASKALVAATEILSCTINDLRVVIERIAVVLERVYPPGGTA